jgi:hypothetical protein
MVIEDFRWFKLSTYTEWRKLVIERWTKRFGTPQLGHSSSAPFQYSSCSIEGWPSGSINKRASELSGHSHKKTVEGNGIRVLGYL